MEKVTEEEKKTNKNPIPALGVTLGPQPAFLEGPIPLIMYAHTHCMFGALKHCPIT